MPTVRRRRKTRLPKTRGKAIRKSFANSFTAYNFTLRSSRVEEGISKKGGRALRDEDAYRKPVVQGVTLPLQLT